MTLEGPTVTKPKPKAPDCDPSKPLSVGAFFKWKVKTCAKDVCDQQSEYSGDCPPIEAAFYQIATYDLLLKYVNATRGVMCETLKFEARDSPADSKLVQYPAPWTVTKGCDEKEFKDCISFPVDYKEETGAVHPNSVPPIVAKAFYLSEIKGITKFRTSVACRCTPCGGDVPWKEITYVKWCIKWNCKWDGTESPAAKPGLSVDNWTCDGSDGVIIEKEPPSRFAPCKNDVEHWDDEKTTNQYLQGQDGPVQEDGFPFKPYRYIACRRAEAPPDKCE